MMLQYNRILNLTRTEFKKHEIGKRIKCQHGVRRICFRLYKQQPQLRLIERAKNTPDAKFKRVERPMGFRLIIRMD